MEPAVLIHAIAAMVAAAVTLLMIGLAVGATAGFPLRRSTLDRVLLAGIVVVTLAGGTGLVLLGGGGPRDPLHVLYGLVALLALPVTRGVAVRDDAPPGTGSRAMHVGRPFGRWLLLGGLITAGALLRLAMTG